MNRRTAPWVAVGCLVLAILVAIPIGFGVWAFRNAGDLLSRSPGLLLTQSPQSIPQTGNPSDLGQAATPNRYTGSNEPLGSLGLPSTQRAASLADLYDQVHTGAVNISVEVVQNGQVGAGAGSGFVLTDTGYIVTNHHVVESADQLHVVFFNNQVLPATVVGSDADSDLAIIKVDRLPDGVIPLPLGDSDAARVGDEVVAIGNPFALGTSMSYGIVSATGRVIPSGFTQFNIPSTIQTDAAINPGNSGGPLINMEGEVIGVNAQIRTATDGGGNLGIGFAIPSNILKLVYPDIIAKGDYNWPFLGISGGTMSEAIAQQFNLDKNLSGAFIGDVTSGGPADKAGVQANDVIIKVDGKSITTFDELLSAVSFRKPGDTVAVTVSRNGNEKELQVTLGERPSNSQNSP